MRIEDKDFRDVPHIIEMLHSQDPRIRREIIRNLYCFDNMALLPALSGVYKQGEHRDIKCQLISLIGSFDHPDAMDAIVDIALVAGDEEQRRQALSTHNAWRDRRASEALQYLSMRNEIPWVMVAEADPSNCALRKKYLDIILDHPEPVSIMYSAIDAFFCMEPEPCLRDNMIKLFLDCAAYPHEVKEGVLHFFAKIREPVPPIILKHWLGLLRSESKLYRITGAEIISFVYWPKQAAPWFADGCREALIIMVRSTDPWEREAAIEALCAMADDTDLPIWDDLTELTRNAIDDNRLIGRLLPIMARRRDDRIYDVARQLAESDRKKEKDRYILGAYCLSYFQRDEDFPLILKYVDFLLHQERYHQRDRYRPMLSGYPDFACFDYLFWWCEPFGTLARFPQQEQSKEILMKSLSTTEWRGPIIEALGSFIHGEINDVTVELLRIFKDEKEKTQNRVAAAEVLARHGLIVCAEDMIKVCLSTGSSSLAEEILEAIQPLAQDLTIEHLNPLLNSLFEGRNNSYNYYLLKFLALSENQRILPYIARFFKDGSNDNKCRCFAAAIIGNSKDEDYEEVLKTGLNDRSSRVREASLQALTALLIKTAV